MDGSVTDTLLEQVRACARISKACMDTDPAKRPNTESIMNILAQIEIMGKVEKSSSAMSVAKVSLLMDNSTLPLTFLKLLSTSQFFIFFFGLGWWMKPLSVEEEKAGKVSQVFKVSSPLSILR